MNKEEAKKDDKDEDPSYVMFTKETKSTVYDVYLTTSFEGPEKYHKLYNLLEHALDGDKFNFYLNSYGGRLDSGVQFVNKLGATKASTKCIIESTSYSMGAIFPFACGEVEMREHTSLMFHNFSASPGRAKGNEHILNLENTSSMFKKLLYEVCGKVLTSPEIEDIVQGKDLYLTRDQINERMI